jgi:hypothetical protein
VGDLPTHGRTCVSVEAEGGRQLFKQEAFLNITVRRKRQVSQEPVTEEVFTAKVREFRIDNTRAPRLATGNHSIISI